MIRFLRGEWKQDTEAFFKAEPHIFFLDILRAAQDTEIVKFIDFVL